MFIDGQNAVTPAICACIHDSTVLYCIVAGKVTCCSICSTLQLVLYTYTSIMEASSYRQRPIPWLKPGEAALPSQQPVASPAPPTAARQILKRLERQLHAMQERLDQLASASLPPCDLPSMSAVELHELLEEHKDDWIHKSNQCGMQAMLEMARRKGKQFRESSWFKVKKEVIADMKVQLFYSSNP